MPTRPVTYRPTALPHPRQPECRPDRHQRGYTNRWYRYVKWFLSQPENALCVECYKQGILNGEDRQVDHRIPSQGPADPLHWDTANHQTLCRRHHCVKTAKDRAAGLTRKSG